MVIIITGNVPAIAWIKENKLFCNSPHGYVLYKEKDGIKTELERSDHPVFKQLDFQLEVNENYVLVVR
jgi:hypothetical protein